MKNIYQLVAENLKRARAKLGNEEFPQPSKLKPGDSVLIKDHTAKAFAHTYKGNYRIVSIKGNQVELMPGTGGKSFHLHVTDVKYILLADSIIAQLPDYNKFGRKN